MITVGIDSGNRNTKAVMLRDGQVVARAIILSDFNADKAAIQVYRELLSFTGVKTDDIAAVVSTGVGRKAVKIAQTDITEIVSASRGVHFIDSEVNIVLDLGAESSRAIRLNPDGKINNFAVNDRCATGAGAFIEAIARVLQTSPEEMGSLSLNYTKEIPMNAQCVVFAESEVISLIHRRTAKEDIAHAVHEGVASRISSLARRIGIKENIMVIGGLGYNNGLIESLTKDLGKTINVPEGPDYVSALGAAVYARSIPATES